MKLLSGRLGMFGSLILRAFLAFGWLLSAAAGMLLDHTSAVCDNWRGRPILRPRDRTVGGEAQRARRSNARAPPTAALLRRAASPSVCYTHYSVLNF